MGLRSTSRFGLWQIWPHGGRHGTYEVGNEGIHLGWSLDDG